MPQPVLDNIASMLNRLAIAHSGIGEVPINIVVTTVQNVYF